LNSGSIRNTVIWLTAFSIAMGYLESAVVVYLRALYYPDGFEFPLVPIDQYITWTEIAREAATIIMLVGAGAIAGKNASERFAFFIYCFAIWDIFYYIFLKVILNWPESLMTWDILFLIPVTWTGPVITPILISLTMILLAGSIISFNRKSGSVRITFREWALLILGSLVVVIAFIWDYCSFMLQRYSFSELLNLSYSELINLATQYVPQSFNWWLFGAGEFILLITILIFWKRNKTIDKTVY